MLRKALLGLTGLTLLTGGVVVPWFLHGHQPPTALAADSSALRDLACRDADLRAPLAPDFGLVRTPDVAALESSPVALGAAPGRTLDADRAHATPLTPAEIKALAKLDKKLAAAHARMDKAEAAQAKLAGTLDSTQALLDAAGDLPTGTPAQVKAKAKLLAKLAKAAAKLQAKLDKGDAKLNALEDAADALAGQITVLDPDHFADVQGLQAPETLSVVAADTETEGGGGAGIFGGGDFLLGGGDFPLLSDFNQDSQHRFVYDPSMKTLDTVNMILGLLAQTAYDEMVNAGTYVAQIDESLVANGEDGSSSGSDTGESSGGNAEAPQLWVVKSTRASDDSPQLVKFWLPQESEDDGEGSGKSVSIRGQMEVTKGISDVDPFGAFNLNFADVPLDGDLADATEFGNLRTLDVADGFIGFSFFETEGDLTKPVFLPGEHAQVTQANVNMFDDKSQGVARIRRQSRGNDGPDGDTGVQTEEYLLAFNDLTVLRAKDSDQPICLSRSDFAERVFRYGLYHAQGDDVGARVDRNGGFGFKTASGQYGWIGYYGMWAPPNVSIESGDIVTKSDFGGGPATAYTVVSAPGKLIRNTRQQLALADADGEQFTWWDFPAPSGPPPGDGGGGAPAGEGGEGGGPPPGGGGQQPNQPVQYRVEYEHGSGQFLKVATFDPSNGQFTELEAPEAIDVEAHGNFLQMFSESLGGPVSWVSGQPSLTYYQRQFVTGSDELFTDGDDVALLGFQNCLKAGITSEEATLG
ncbi:MAG TPA: hypothetical protein VK824_01750, partial [Planctomycetota bacterium]|nr:hypothetical protein [Planctomycetota bacterium]